MRRFARLALTVLAVALALAPAAQPAAAAEPVPVSEIVGRISPASYQAYQNDVQNMGLGLYGGPAYNQGYRNRYNSGGSATETLGFKEANLYLKDKFAAMGLSVTEQSDYRNVIAELPGTETPGVVYIVCAHYDHPERAIDAPGGDDNASGVAGVLEAARVLSANRYKATIRFVAWGGEEGWMKGSWDYVRNVVKPNADPTHQNIAGVLNLDMILRPGWDSDPTHAKDLDIGTRMDIPACAAWADDFRAAAATYAPALAVNAPHGEYYEWYASDQGPFMRDDQGFMCPGLMVAENTAEQIWYQGPNAYYHTAGDASDRGANDPNNASGITYDWAFATDVVRASVGMIAQEAQVDVPEPMTAMVLVAGSMALVRRRRQAA